MSASAARAVGHPHRASRWSRSAHAIFLAAWPVLAAFALCPLAALLAPSDPSAALARGAWIAGAESTLGLRFEPATAGWLAAQPALHAAAEFFYLWIHLPATVGVLVWAWLERRHAFRRARDSFVLVQATVVAVNLLLPTAPPWMGRAEASQERLADLVQSPLAAMPSGHAAFATFAAVTLWTLVRSRAVRAAAAVYLVLVFAIVIATDNHYWLDVAAGAAIAALVLRVRA